MVDCMIIGSGMAGISAALTLKANGKSFLLMGSPALSEKIEKAEEIRNYPAFLGGSGKALAESLKAQLKAQEIEVTDAKATGVYALTDKFAVLTQAGETYESRSVILACGVESVKSIDGEEAFLGRGVSYCATCDGFLYKGKTVAALCSSKRLEGEVEHLAKFAEKVYLIALYKPVELQEPNVELLRKMPLKIVGDKRVTALAFKDGELPVDGVFVLKDSVSPAVLVAGLTTEQGKVVVDRSMATNLAGVYAAGDCTGRPFQYAKAVGEGNVAAHSVTEFLAKMAAKG